MSFRALIQILVVTALASGCGFHLRGKLPISERLQPIAVSISDRGLRDEMVKALKASGADVVSDETTARAVLDMYDVTFERKVNTIDTRGKVTGYKLRYDVKYRVVDEKDKELRDAKLKIEKSYNFDPNQVLQAKKEEEALKENMIEELARRIMRQLVTIAGRALGLPGSRERVSA
ncbi:MAG: LPS-assembly lipoprotein LptE [Gammaproteobacteria bacterium]|nr:LPS-assembly lipoprotein LptE [Gammaproteobacteria bacterium]